MPGDYSGDEVAQLREQLRHLQAQVAHLEAIASRGNDPFGRVLIAKRGQEPGRWKEWTVNEGELEEFIDGRGNDAGGDAGIRPLGGCSALLEVLDVDAHQYVEIGPRYRPVTLAQDGGADGSAAAPATYTYTVTDEEGDVIGEQVAPEKARADGKRFPASKGQAYYDRAGVLKLWDTDERDRTTTC
jgi:hypothetical protein